MLLNACLLLFHDLSSILTAGPGTAHHPRSSGLPASAAHPLCHLLPHQHRAPFGSRPALLLSPNTRILSAGALLPIFSNLTRSKYDFAGMPHLYRHPDHPIFASLNSPLRILVLFTVTTEVCLSRVFHPVPATRQSRHLRRCCSTKCCPAILEPLSIVKLYIFNAGC